MRYGAFRQAAVRLVLLAAVLMMLAHRAAAAGERVGIVLMHGEQGSSGRVITGLAGALERAGYLVARPDMCWSARRGYEAEFPTCLTTIDAAIVRLRNLGATQIVVGGFSFGGTAAIAYGALHPQCLGIMAIAPDHDARVAAARPEIAASVTRARALVTAGQDETTGQFSDIAIGPDGIYDTEIATTPAIYLSFFSAASQATIAANIAVLAPPLLWVAGSADPDQGEAAKATFARARGNKLSRFVVVTANHLATPDVAGVAVLDWLAALARR